MPHPLSLAVVTPSFNTAKYLGAAISSVIEQDWPAVDYIVMDGGSTDGSVDVLRSFGDRVKWVSEKDKGQSDAINKGFARTHGDVLAWLNSDDTYAPGAFSAAMRFLEANPDIDVVYGDADYIDFQGRLIGPCTHIEPYNRHRLFHYSDYIVQPTTFFRRSAFEKVGGIDASIHWAMDYDLWLRLAKQFKFAYLPTLLAHFRWLDSNKTATGGMGRLNEIRRILGKHDLPDPAYIRLERVNQHVQAAAKAAKDLRPGACFREFTAAAGDFLSCPRAVVSMFQPTTWRIIWTGQVLRARAEREAAAHQTRSSNGEIRIKSE